MQIKQKTDQHLPNNYTIGETVICCGEKDKIVSFITPDDKENYEMGYRVTLENNGTQSLEMISKL